MAKCVDSLRGVAAVENNGDEGLVVLQCHGNDGIIDAFAGVGTFGGIDLPGDTDDDP